MKSVPRSGYPTGQKASEDELQITLKQGEPIGVSFQFDTINMALSVVEFVPNSPARKMGVKLGMYLTHIDGQPVIGLDQATVVDTLKSKVNASRQLFFQRPVIGIGFRPKFPVSSEVLNYDPIILQKNEDNTRRSLKLSSQGIETKEESTDISGLIKKNEHSQASDNLFSSNNRRTNLPPRPPLNFDSNERNMIGSQSLPYIKPVKVNRKSSLKSNLNSDSSLQSFAASRNRTRRRSTEVFVSADLEQFYLEKAMTLEDSRRNSRTQIAASGIDSSSVSTSQPLDFFNYDQYYAKLHPKDEEENDDDDDDDPFSTPARRRRIIADATMFLLRQYCIRACHHVKLYREEMKAATKIQCCIRRHLSKKILLQLRFIKQTNAAVVIQCALRRTFARLEIDRRRRRNHLSKLIELSPKVQRAWRCYRARRKVEALRRERELRLQRLQALAVLRLQSQLRGYLSRKLTSKIRQKWLQKHAEQRKACVRIQSLWRKILAVRRLKRLRKERIAHGRLQENILRWWHIKYRKRMVLAANRLSRWARKRSHYRKVAKSFEAQRLEEERRQREEEAERLEEDKKKRVVVGVQVPVLDQILKRLMRCHMEDVINWCIKRNLLRRGDGGAYGVGNLVGKMLAAAGVDIASILGSSSDVADETLKRPFQSTSTLGMTSEPSTSFDEDYNNSDEESTQRSDGNVLVKSRESSFPEAPKGFTFDVHLEILEHEIKIHLQFEDQEIISLESEMSTSFSPPIKTVILTLVSDRTLMQDEDAGSAIPPTTLLPEKLVNNSDGIHEMDAKLVPSKNISSTVTERVSEDTIVNRIITHTCDELVLSTRGGTRSSVTDKTVPSLSEGVANNLEGVEQRRNSIQKLKDLRNDRNGVSASKRRVVPAVTKKDDGGLTTISLTIDLEDHEGPGTGAADREEGGVFVSHEDEPVRSPKRKSRHGSVIFIEESVIRRSIISSAEITSVIEEQTFRLNEDSVAALESESGLQYDRLIDGREFLHADMDADSDDDSEDEEIGIRMSAAALTIQSLARGRQCRNALARQHMSASLIQRVWRTGVQMSRWKSTEADVVRNAKRLAIHIQRLWRGLLGRRRTALTRESCCYNLLECMNKTVEGIISRSLQEMANPETFLGYGSNQHKYEWSPPFSRKSSQVSFEYNTTPSATNSFIQSSVWFTGLLDAMDMPFPTAIVSSTNGFGSYNFTSGFEIEEMNPNFPAATSVDNTQLISDSITTTTSFGDVYITLENMEEGTDNITNDDTSDMFDLTTLPPLYSLLSSRFRDPE